MANYQKKYYYTFRDLRNQEYTVEIWQDSATVLVASEIKADVQPFVLEYYSISNKFDPVRPSGFEMNLISVTDRQFEDLYTDNMLEYIVKLYQEEEMVWVGFLDSELFKSSFSEIDNYPVQFTGSDGLALLERIEFADISSNLLYGISSNWDVLKLILNKLSLPWKALYVSLSTTSTDFTISDNETIFHHVCGILENYINEDGEPETCRKVLENILKIQTAFIIQDNGSLFITDINTTAGNDAAIFKKYDAQTFNYIGTETIDLNIGDLSAIGFASDSQQLSVVSGYNKQVVKYSPYRKNSIIDFNPTNDFSTAGAVSKYGSSSYTWQETEYSTSKLWNKSHNGKFVKMEALPITANSSSEYYLKIGRYPHVYTCEESDPGLNPDYLSLKNKIKLPTLICSKYKLKIKMSAYVRTFDDYENPSDSSSDIGYLYLRCALKLFDSADYEHTRNNQGYDKYTGVIPFDLTFWQCTGSSAEDNYNKTIENDWIDLAIQSWNPVKKIVKTSDFMIDLSVLNPMGNHPMEFSIYDWYVYGRNNMDNSVNSKVKDIRIKDISFSLVDPLGRELSNDDIEYVGYMDSNFKNEGSKIELMLGTSMDKNPVERGALIYYDQTNKKYAFCSTFIREGVTDIIESLLLRSIIGNYTKPSIELNCTTNKIPSVLGFITYTKYLEGKKLMPTSIKHNLEDFESEIVMQEFIKDGLSINKSF